MRKLLFCGAVGIALSLCNFAPALAEPTCKPSLAVRNAGLSEMLLPTLERRWNATVSVDASDCSGGSTGYFEIVFSRLKENGPDTVSRERFKWAAPSVSISTPFSADEAIQSYSIDNDMSCPCRK